MGQTAVKEIKLTSAVYSPKRRDAKLLLEEMAAAAAAPAAAAPTGERAGGSVWHAGGRGGDARWPACSWPASGRVGPAWVPAAPSLGGRDAWRCAGTAWRGCGAGNTVAKRRLQQNAVTPLK